MCALKIDLIHSGIGSGLGGAQILTQRGNAKHASATGHNVVPGPSRAGMEYLGVRLSVGRVKTADKLALGIIVTGCRWRWRPGVPRDRFPSG